MLMTAICDFDATLLLYDNNIMGHYNDSVVMIISKMRFSFYINNPYSSRFGGLLKCAYVQYNTCIHILLCSCTFVYF